MTIKNIKMFILNRITGSCYPSTLNELIFTDTTPCDDTDFNTEYEVIDQSFNI